MLPRREVVAEGLEAEVPDALLEQRHFGLPTVETVVQRVQAMQRFVSGRREETHLHADAIMSLAECRDAERHDLAVEGLGSVITPGDGR